MWMKHDPNKENTKNEGALLRCPMCKGRGYFEPTEVATTKSSFSFSQDTETRPCNTVKLPSLQTKSDAKQWPKPRYKYSLPSINKSKNFPENTSGDMGEHEIQPHVPPLKDFRDKQSSFDEIGNSIPHKLESRMKTGMSQRVSRASSRDSNTEKHLIPSPKTPKNPSETLRTSMAKLKTSNWSESLNALRDIVQLSRFQPRMLEPCMVTVHRGLIFLLKSFRSTVVRTACQAANELFATMATVQRPEFDELINVLLQKTADTNKAVRQDANEALDTMVINIPPTHSVRTITQKGLSHKSPIVRGAAARLLVCVVGVAGVEAIFNGSKEIRGRIINAGAIFMQDGCQEVRNFGKRLMKMLMQHEEFEDVLQSEVNEILLKRIEKTLITMKYKNN